MTPDSQTVSVLNDLIGTSKDGQYGFTQCAERAQSLPLRAELRQQATECESAAAELQTLVIRFGGKPQDSGSLGGAVYRGWISLKDALTPDSDAALLAECERGERQALAHYRAAMHEDLPPEARVVVRRQLHGVELHHDRIRALRVAIAN